MQPSISTVIALAAEKLSKCSMIMIGAGAGMGRDSGLPDFRGNEGFWNNYPPYRNKFNFFQCANPQFLQTSPHLFWGFYGSRLVMYREKRPHRGFKLLRDLSNKMKSFFVITSNVDGHFQHCFQQKDIYQVHGSIHYLQCSTCNLLSQNKFKPEIDYNQMSCKNLPKCQKCNNNLRPNILMFGDWQWLQDRSQKQQSYFKKFTDNCQQKSSTGQEKLAIIEIGCGRVVPTIRNMCQQQFYKNKNSILIRINPDDEPEAKYMDKQRFFHIKENALVAIQNLVKIAYKIQ